MFIRFCLYQCVLPCTIPCTVPCFDMEAEIVKQLDELQPFRQHLENYFKEIWSKKQVPNAWRKSKITPIWKNKGSSQDPTKYRGISNSSVLSKVGINIIIKRLSNFYNSQLMRSQFGFRSGMGCPDAIYDKAASRSVICI